jgi:hypothetical protein
MDILWDWRIVLVRHAVRLAVLKELQSCLDMLIGRVQICCSLIGVQSVGGLVVARLILEKQLAFCGTS